jgi:tetratricopeptide (TPR) repeat protein/2-polyprenyl-3-methyl-5-hydroxy-6-metoxy-1,4-benzoquinol methylase
MTGGRIASANASILALTNVRYQKGKLAEADTLCGRVLGIEPRSAPAHYLRGMIASQRGRSLDAIAHLVQAVSIAPQVAAAHQALAEAYRMAERLIDAERHYRIVAELHPGAITFLNHGNAVMVLGQPAKAANIYEAALYYDASLPELYLALGRSYAALDRREAIGAFGNAVRLRPDSVEAHEGLLDACLGVGDSAAALHVTCEALHRVNTAKLRSGFVGSVTTISQITDQPRLRETMQRALAECWTRPHELTRAACAVIALRQPIDDRDPLLQTLLRLAPVCHPEIEKVLTSCRRSLLHRATTVGSLSPDELESACALATQCYINEFVWTTEPKEDVQVGALWQTIEAKLEQGGTPSDSAIISVAMYRHLASLPGAVQLVSRGRLPCVCAVLEQQIVEPAEEQRLRGVLPRLTTINDAISLAVREQYEANPYPRWVTLPRIEQRMQLGEWLSARFPHAVVAALPTRRPLEVLVAGCGTGQQPLETLRHFVDINVLAIDLSLSSLAYAARMTERLGMDKIAYAQADLLEAGEFGEQFDMIAATGVLHHLADIWSGWRTLLGLLSPGGVMRVALYTVRGRRTISLARHWIAEHGYRATVPAIRSSRQAIMALTDDWARELSTTPDFQSTSSCRDLLFHVQEHAVSLPMVAEFLKNEQIELLGVDVSLNTERMFKAWSGNSDAATGLCDLARWDQFEAQYPSCFAGMVDLWVQKPLLMP